MASAQVTVYTTGWCPYCHRAKSLLQRKKVDFVEVDVDDRPDLRSWLKSASGQTTVPQVFVNNRALGGYSDISALDGQGRLDPLLAEPAPAGLPALPR
ncbi:MAG: glutaredoxin 3 [Polyangiaceae bacterium]